jgi:solute:Na+ symporter, SSS family
MFLPSLALATITPLSIQTSILIMGGLGILYCTLGGLEAVIWTDSIQTIILLGGAFLSFGIIIANLEGGFSNFFDIAHQSGKFHIANWDWGIGSIATSAFWVVLLGGIAQQLVPFASDQSIIQRYMSVNSEKKAANAIWTNAIIVVPATIIFFALGSALFVFYKANPSQLDPNFQNDAIFPLFIATKLPAGLAGLVVAGIFAAAQSTISTSMNSTSTAIVTDFVKRFNSTLSEKNLLRIARAATITTGIMGTGFALLLATADIKSLWDTFMKVLGLFGGPLCGVFLLGMLSKKSSTAGAIAGLIFGLTTVAYVQNFTQVSYLIHAGIGIVACMLTGYAVSLAFPVERNYKE